MGPIGRGRHGHPPEHRVPVPSGSLLLDLRPARRARLGRAAALDGQLALRSRGRRPLPREDSSGSTVRARSSPGWPTSSVPTSSSTSSGPRPSCCPGPVSAGCSPLRPSPCAGADGATRRCSPSSWRSSARPTQPRSSTSGSPPSPGSSTRCFVLHEAPGRSCLQRRIEDGHPVARRLHVLDRRAAHRGRLRRQRPELHRDAAGDRGDLARVRGHPRTRLLVLLRQSTGSVRGSRPPSSSRRAPGCSPRASPCPPLAAVVAAISRWRAKAFFVLLILVGVVLAVGIHPYNDPSIVGRALKVFMTESSAGLALRSTDRATPLVVLGFSMLLGVGSGRDLVATAPPRAPHRRRAGRDRGCQQRPVPRRRRRRAALPAPGEDPRLLRRRRPATSTPRAIRRRVLDRAGRRTSPPTTGARPSTPIWPGIMTRPEILREQTIQGSNATTDLLQAFDLTLQQGTYEPSTLAPIARLFSAGDVVLQSNLAYWRYNTPRPQETWALFNPPPAGIGKPVSFGAAVPNIAPAKLSLNDEEALALPTDAPWPPPIAVFPVSDPRPIYRAEPAGCPSRDRRQWSRRRRCGGGRPPRRQPDDLLRRHARRRTPSCCVKPSPPPPSWSSPTPTARCSNAGRASATTSARRFRPSPGRPCPTRRR